MMSFLAQDKFIKMNRSGFSLVETMIALVITGIVMTGIMTYVFSLNKSLSQLSEKHNILDLGRQIEFALSEPELCKCMLGDKAIGAPSEKVAIEKLTIGCDSSSHTLKKDDMVDPNNSGLKIDSMFLLNNKQIVSEIYSVDLEVGFKSQHGNPHRPLRKTLFYKLKDAKISTCGDVTQTQASICAFVGGTLNASSGRCDLPIPPPQIIAASEPPVGFGANIPSHIDCPPSTCYVPMTIEGAPPNSAILASGTGTDPNGVVHENTSSTNVGSTDSKGRWNYTGTTDCGASWAKGWTFQQSYVVGDRQIASHSWSCPK